MAIKPKVTPPSQAEPPSYTRQSSYRFPDDVIQLLDRMADDLQTNRTKVLIAGAFALADQLGYRADDAIEAVQKVIKEHGEDTPITVTVTAWDKASITIAGEPAEPEWYAWPMVMFDEDSGTPLGAPALYCRWQPRNVNFKLPDPRSEDIGASSTVKAGSLLDYVLLKARENRTPAQLRRDLRMNLALRRMIEDATASRQHNGKGTDD
jgi:hypothetical protein